MQIYFAPMEGMTGYLYRSLHQQYFGGVDKYFIPFLSPTKEHVFSRREIREILPENNLGIHAVPQLLTRKAEDFLWAADMLFDMGYEEIDLNLGCPSGTVTAKGKGAGLLAVPEELDQFLDGVYSKVKGPVSIKTRLGMNDPEEFDRLLEVYRRYPVHELIIHPRVRNEFYKESVHLDVFRRALQVSKAPVCYNGDIAVVEDLQRYAEAFPEVDRVMIGRGLAADPALAEKLRGDLSVDKERLRCFHDALYEGYCTIFESRKNAMMRMKEYWSYHILLFADSEKYAKKIKKATDPKGFEAVTASVFQDLELLPGTAAEWKTEARSPSCF